MRKKRVLLLFLCCYLAVLVLVQLSYDLFLFPDEVYGAITVLLGGKLWLLGLILGFGVMLASVFFAVAASITF